MCLSQEATRVYPRSSASQTKSASLLKTERKFGYQDNEKDVWQKPAQANVSEIVLAKMFSTQYIGMSWLIRYSIRVALIYEKDTMVIFEPYSRCRRAHHCRDPDV